MLLRTIVHSSESLLQLTCVGGKSDAVGLNPAAVIGIGEFGNDLIESEFLVRRYGVFAYSFFTD
jgi:hypothetical protein